MLTIRNLSKTYDNGVQALKGIDLDIPKGMFGLVGPNGAGKSTLMRTLATLQEADSGTVDFDGLDVLTDKEEVRKVLGYLPQEFGVYARISCQEMLEHFAVLKGITNPRDRKAAVETLLRMTNLWEVRKRRLGTYSGGMRQRFGIAQALLANPKLLIVDEPTAGLDPEERRRFLNLLSEIGENVVIILSTHIVEDVSEICSHMAVIDRGEVRVTGDPRSLIAGIRGKIWQKLVERDEVEGYEASMPVISTRLFAGQTVLRVHSDESPGEGFEVVEPDLEDVYFTVLKQDRTGNLLSA
jgi:ABC-type multidrug transport system ATPase subunit